MAADLPASLKVIQPFLKLAKEYDKRDPVVAYWSRYHAVQMGIKNKTKDNISFLMNLMDVLEKTKQQQNQEEAIINDIVAQAYLENKGTQLFLWADTEDRAARFNKYSTCDISLVVINDFILVNFVLMLYRNVVKSFYSAYCIFEIISVFGEINDEILAQRKYAKWKAAYINNCLKKGENPIPGPVGGDGDRSAAFPPTGGLPYPAESTMPGLPPSVVYPPPSAMSGGQGPIPSQQYPPQVQAPTAHQTPNQPTASSTSGVALEAMDFTKAQKYCKYASSALQYEDVSTAIDNLQKALKLLQTGKE